MGGNIQYKTSCIGATKTNRSSPWGRNWFAAQRMVRPTGKRGPMSRRSSGNGFGPPSVNRGRPFHWPRSSATPRTKKVRSQVTWNSRPVSQWADVGRWLASGRGV